MIKLKVVFISYETLPKLALFVRFRKENPIFSLQASSYEDVSEQIANWARRGLVCQEVITGNISR